MARADALRIIFFGTPEIAVPTLEALIAGPHEVVGVVSQPDRGRGRGRKLSPSPISEVALREEIPLIRPEKVGDPETVAALAALQPDLGVVVAFGQFIPKKVREMPTAGYLINAHASLLPKYRGAAPIARAILDAETETGVSVMRVEKKMDAGPFALMKRIPIGPTVNVVELSGRIATVAADAIGEAVEQIAAKRIAWTEQDADAVTFAAKIEKSDAVLDLRESARALAARLHAVSPKPGGAITLKRGNEAIVLKISRAEWFGGGDDSGAILGTAVLGKEEGEPALRIITGEGSLIPLVMQRPGGKPLPVADFLRGFDLAEGECFSLIEASDRAELSDSPDAHKGSVST